MNIDIDISGLTFIDSAAIGMMLILNEEVRKIGGRVSLSNPKGQVNRVLTATQLDKLIKIFRSKDNATA